LLARANTLTGKTLAQLSAATGLPLPANHRHHKGWTGRLAEICLGADAANLAQPDFRLIGVELKTIPINRLGNPGESTYVCMVNLAETAGLQWQASTVRRKLARVLWLPVEGVASIPFAHRRFGTARLWSPDPVQEAVLREDWEEIMELIATGNLDQISSAQGRYLQVRPKAASGKSLGVSFNEDGIRTATLPRGFYLRASFTRTLFGN
jgi:DNA mismatch repair protein MutH